MIFRLKNEYKILRLFALVLIFWLAANSAEAASMYLNPPSGTYLVGSDISVDVLVTTNEEANAISGIIRFPADKLEAVSVSRAGSVVDLWLQEPAVSRGLGEVVFEGLILNPGFVGTGKIITINFRVTEVGDSNVTLSSGLVLANDGFGTNILKDLQGANFSLTGSLELEDEPGIKRPEPVVLPPEPTDIILGQLRPPVVTSYTRNPRILAQFSAQGVTYPNSNVKIFIQPEGGEVENIEEYVVSSDLAGNFTYAHKKNTNPSTLLQAGVFLSIASAFREDAYSFWLSVVQAGEESDTTQSFEFIVGGLETPELMTLVTGIIVVAVLIIAIVALLVLYARYLNRTLKKRREGAKKKERLPEWNKEVLKEVKEQMDVLEQGAEKNKPED